jgi:uncharacterized phiE125 gp8 family phage protein
MLLFLLNLAAAASPISGSAAITDAAEMAAATGAARSTGQTTVADGADTTSASGAAVAAGAAAIADAGEAAAGSGASLVAGTASTADGADTASATAVAKVTAAGSATDSAESVAGSSSVADSAAGAVTDTGESLAASGSTADRAVGSIADDAEAASLAAAVQDLAAGTIAESGEDLAAAAAAPEAGSGAIGDGPDALAAAGTVPIGGSLSTSETDEQLAADAASAIAGSATIADPGGALTGTAAVGGIATGAAQIDELADVGAAAGAVTATGIGDAADPGRFQRRVCRRARAWPWCRCRDAGRGPGFGSGPPHRAGAMRRPCRAERKSLRRCNAWLSADGGSRGASAAGPGDGAHWQNHESEEGRMIIWPAKEPTAAENFAFNFADALGSEKISTQVVVGAGVTVSGATIDGTSVTFKLAAGTAGTVAKVTCTVVLSDGQTLVETGVLPIGGEAVSLATAKAAQRIDQNSEDALLAGYLGAAIGHVERITGRNLTAKVERLALDGFPRSTWAPLTAFDWQERPIRLQKAPVSEILTIDYDDADGVEQSLLSFRLVDGAPARILPAYGECWPVAACSAGSVRITYVAGYDPTALPADLVHAAIILFGHFNSNREAVTIDGGAAATAIDLLVSPYRVTPY